MDQRIYEDPFGRFTSRSYVASIGASSVGCDLGAGDYFVIIKAATAGSARTVDVQIKTKGAPSWMCGSTDGGVIALIVILVIVCCCLCLCAIAGAFVFGGVAACAACCKSNKHNSGGAGRYATQTNNPSVQQVEMSQPQQQVVVVQGTAQPAVVQGTVVQPAQPMVVKGAVITGSTY